MSPPFLHMLGTVQYSTVVQYNIEAAPEILQLLHVQYLHYKPVLNHFSKAGGEGTKSSCTVLHSCHPVTYKYYKKNINLIYLFTVTSIHSSNNIVYCSTVVPAIRVLSLAWAPRVFHRAMFMNSVSHGKVWTENTASSF
jgi:hypothetical protein